MKFRNRRKQEYIIKILFIMSPNIIIISIRVELILI